MIKVQTMMVVSAGLLFSFMASAEHQQAPNVTKKITSSVKKQQAPKAAQKLVTSTKKQQAPTIRKKLAVSAKKQQAPAAMTKVEPLPRDLEIELALSALPPHLRDHATVYVLNPDKGFQVARAGTNGFHALVSRTDEGAFRQSGALTQYRDDILVPISFDQAGSRAQMRVILDMAALQAMGTSPTNLNKVVQSRFRAGYYKAPSRAGVSYMLSPILRTYENPDEGGQVSTINMPHVMYYAPNVTNADIGGKPMSMYPFVVMPGPHGYIVQALGQMETQAINKEYETMLARLCQIKDAWCLPQVKQQH